MVSLYMNEVSRTRSESMSGGYVSPFVKVIWFQSEGVLCESVGSEHEGFGDGGEYDL